VTHVGCREELGRCPVLGCVAGERTAPNPAQRDLSRVGPWPATVHGLATWILGFGAARVWRLVSDPPGAYRDGLDDAVLLLLTLMGASFLAAIFHAVLGGLQGEGRLRPGTAFERSSAGVLLAVLLVTVLAVVLPGSHPALWPLLLGGYFGVTALAYGDWSGPRAPEAPAAEPEPEGKE
jgi:hypothetical protein